MLRLSVQALQEAKLMTVSSSPSTSDDRQNDSFQTLLVKILSLDSPLHSGFGLLQ